MPEQKPTPARDRGYFPGNADSRAATPGIRPLGRPNCSANGRRPPGPTEPRTEVHERPRPRPERLHSVGRIDPGGSDGPLENPTVKPVSRGTGGPTRRIRQKAPPERHWGTGGTRMCCKPSSVEFKPPRPDNRPTPGESPRTQLRGAGCRQTTPPTATSALAAGRPPAGSRVLLIDSRPQDPDRMFLARQGRGTSWSTSGALLEDFPDGLFFDAEVFPNILN